MASGKVIKRATVQAEAEVDSTELRNIVNAVVEATTFEKTMQARVLRVTWLVALCSSLSLGLLAIVSSQMLYLLPLLVVAFSYAVVGLAFKADIYFEERNVRKG